jgi:hypothetical protein
VASEISLLIPDFRKQLIRALDAAKAQGLQIEVITTIITPLEQGSLWKQGRTRTDAELKVMALKDAKAPYLAECLQKSVPQGTNVETNLLPGYSWHQWGEAVQIVWVDGSHKVVWDTSATYGRGGYRKFAKIVQELGIHCAAETDDISWRTITLRASPNAGDIYKPPEIDAEMQKRFRR